MAESRAPHAIEVGVVTRFIADESAAGQNRYLFAYDITISNRGAIGAQLLSRHWVITDADGRAQEVRGDGVVGQQPHLAPGETFHYTSGAILETPVGSMYGSYRMVDDQQQQFDVPIAPFTLSQPGQLH
jgi:ApaG protein